MGTYDYFVHPITDGIPHLSKGLLDEVVDHICEICEFDCDLIAGAEAMAIPIITALTLRTGVPSNVIRKRRYGLPGEVSVKQITGYSSKDLYINGIKRGHKVVIIDDVISTGGTIKAVVEALRRIGAEIMDVIIVVEKIDDKSIIERELGVEIKTLVKIEVKEGKVRLVS